METTEVRCPVGPRRLFTKLLSDGKKPTITASNLIEFSCPECKKLFRTQHNIYCSRVLHRYDLAGELVESVLEDAQVRPRGR